MVIYDRDLCLDTKVISEQKNSVKKIVSERKKVRKKEKEKEGKGKNEKVKEKNMKKRVREKR